MSPPSAAFDKANKFGSSATVKFPADAGGGRIPGFKVDSWLVVSEDATSFDVLWKRIGYPDDLHSGVHRARIIHFEHPAPDALLLIDDRGFEIEIVPLEEPGLWAEWQRYRSTHAEFLRDLDKQLFDRGY